MLKSATKLFQKLSSSNSLKITRFESMQYYVAIYSNELIREKEGRKYLFCRFLGSFSACWPFSHLWHVLPSSRRRILKSIFLTIKSSSCKQYMSWDCQIIFSNRSYSESRLYELNIFMIVCYITVLSLVF